MINVKKCQKRTPKLLAYYELRVYAVSSMIMRIFMIGAVKVCSRNLEFKC